MSVRKNLVLAAAGVVAMGAASMTLAGGGDSMAAPAAVPAAQFQRFAYAELGGGYTITNYDKYNGSANVADNNGGFGFGGALGYQFMPNFAIEAGASYVPTFDQVQSGGTYDVKSWMAYGAARINAAVSDKMGVFGKLGYGYRNLESGANNKDANYWKPVAGLGVSYDVMNNLYATAQYMFMLGDYDNDGGAGPGISHQINAQKDLNMFTVNLGYKLNM